MMVLMMKMMMMMMMKVTSKGKTMISEDILKSSSSP